MLCDTNLWYKLAQFTTSRKSQIAISDIFLVMAKESYTTSIQILDFVKQSIISQDEDQLKLYLMTLRKVMDISDKYSRKRLKICINILKVSF